MTRAEFLESLRQHLAHLPSSEADEIVRDQNEYIADAVRRGRSESEVIQSLGDPRSFATNISAEAKIERAAKSGTLPERTSSTFGAVFAVLALAPLNLIFVLGPFLGVAGILIGGWSVAGAVLLASVAILFGFFVKAIFVSVGIMTHISSFFFIVGFIGLGVIGLLVMVKITEWFLKGTVAYLRWNLNFIRGRA